MDGAAAADKDILGIVRHADDFMRYNLSDGYYKVIFTRKLFCGSLQRQFYPSTSSSRNIRHKLSRNFADFYDVGARQLCAMSFS